MMLKKTTPPLPLVLLDPWLTPYEPQIELRLLRYHKSIQSIREEFGSLSEYARDYKEFGLHPSPDGNGWFYREWAPAARGLFLIGDFNGWDKTRHPLFKRPDGVWEIFLSADDVQPQHGQHYKVHVIGADGVPRDRVPAYTFRAVQDPQTYDFCAQVWNPAETFTWTDQDFDVKQLTSPLIYECHPGMAQEKEGVGTYREFAENILPRVAKTGYNCIQLMAVMEHPYYGSFGYHVSSFFAPTSRFGTPEDLKYLINEAHKLGIAVIMDVVHAHAVKNIAEGLNNFDGSGGQYFHVGKRGHHPAWDSKLFDYSKQEVRQFLLANVRYWLEEFHFDGFRFDGVTSMLYHHHGEGITFDTYDKYFDYSADIDAILYLQLATQLTQELKPGAINIAEDMSGMPGLCIPVEDGGIGFDYRLAMGIPDYWIKTLKHKKDEEWNLQEIWHELTNRRKKEKTVAYAESHDQSLVGDKSLAFWLMDKEMYTHMRTVDKSLIIDRGIAMHKLIRIITMALGGESYLTFMGNEFGHPEWVDFPREGNNWSYKYARRQWSLVDNQELRYQQLWHFEKAMLEMAQQEKLLEQGPPELLHMDHTNNVMAFERAGLIFMFNFNTINSIPDYVFQVLQPGTYQVILSSDDAVFGGFDRIDKSIKFFTNPTKYGPRLSVYTPNRTVQVFKKVE